MSKTQTRAQYLIFGNKEQSPSFVIEKDQKYLRRSIQELQNKIEDHEEKLEERLKSPTPIDDSVVKVLYKTLIDLYDELVLFQSFEENFYNEDSQNQQN